MPTSRSRCRTARGRRSCAGAPSASCSGSCRGTTRTTRWRDSPGPNIVVGNTILLKHAPQCPESAAAIQRVFDEAGFPTGAYTNVYASNDQVADVIADPRVQGVSVTGSERAGAAVAEIAGRNLKKVVLELGGSDPFILLEHRRPRRRRRIGRGGTARERWPGLQRRQALRRRRRPLRAVRRQAHGGADRGRAHAIPSSPDAAMGPLSSTTAADRLEDQLQRAVEGGATLVGGDAHGQLPLARGADGRHAEQRRLPRGAVRPGRDRLPRRLRG